ncbi:hypothetical protein phytr_8720 [Candidatus Phycorickettsia trachydisci]|uniref:Uncharacterized protein n=1 Tax=Candidatus Phycorickettsia trachydisci TaxID=2115978 RepID=A0A2P1P966_9RICK|nr:hypothetical protein [Candidatus Phycorickettsia trachydisci]AVP87803.1 hypothetical protein phytr_8720 [Candidatus Phycorickettsia trachydisci]
MTLLDDPTIATHYVPVRDLVKCLAEGNIDLAIKLYHSPDNHELQYRANGLLSELIYTAQSNKQLLAQINEINHSLCIITFIKNLKNTKENGGSINEMQNTI